MNSTLSLTSLAIASSRAFRTFCIHLLGSCLWGAARSRAPGDLRRDGGDHHTAAGVEAAIDGVVVAVRNTLPLAAGQR